MRLAQTELQRDARVGLPWMDMEHAELARCVDDLCRAAESGDQVYRLAYLIDRLAACARGHFIAEERAMERSNYPDAEAHRLSHKVLLQELELLRSAVGDGYVKLSGASAAHLRAWVALHCQRMDVDLAAHLAREP